MPSAFATLDHEEGDKGRDIRHALCQIVGIPPRKSPLPITMPPVRLAHKKQIRASP